MINGELPGTSMMSQQMPPSYEVATYAQTSDTKKFPTDIKLKPHPEPSYSPPLGPPPPVSTLNGRVTVYHYVHPVTGDRIDSLLPPTHPEMQCLQYGHQPHTRFGIAGILAAIFWFPLGISCLLLDRDTQCTRCKKTLKGRLGTN